MCAHCPMFASPAPVLPVIETLLPSINRVGSLVLAGVLLTSCWERQGVEDLRRFQSESVAALKTEVEPLPVVLPPPRFSYSAERERDPFSLRNVITPKPTEVVKLAPSPDKNRPREPLEAFTLGQLKMVGTLKRDGRIWALIRLPDYSIHRVTTGHYMGEHSGQVVSITESEVLLAETHRAPDGNWVKSKASLRLVEQL